MTVIQAAATGAVGLPLLAALANGANGLAGGRLYRPATVARVAVWGIFGALVAGVALVVSLVVEPGAHQVTIYRWMASGDLRADFAFLLDPLAVVMILVVTSISWLVARFSVNYMHNEEGFGRYFTVLPLFVFAMLVLVMADNYLLMFLGWEGVGVCSYLLISFYRDRPASARAGTRAFVMNRVGDANLLVAMFFLFVYTGSFAYVDIFARASALPRGVAEGIGFLLLVGAVGKSAQLPLGTWLARAMEGPTPSSALIHAATMVTAGVYLVARSAPIYAHAPSALLAVGTVGALTVLYAQLVGYAQTDVKGMLAASTVAQLGVMFVFCGLGLYAVAIFHLVVHAFYKSYLFLTAPSILHHLHGGPDPRAVRKPADTAPAAGALVLGVAALLVALPLLARLVPLGRDGLDRGTWVLVGLAVVASFGAAFSTYRMVKVTFAGHGDGHGQHERQGTGRRLLVPLLVLAALAGAGVVAGVLPGGVEGTWFHELLGAAADSAVPPGSLVLVILFGAALVALLISGVYGPRHLDRFREEQPAGAMPGVTRHLYWGALNRGYLDDFYDRTIVRATTSVGRALAGLDRRVFERAPMARGGAPARETETWADRFDAVRRAHAAGSVVLAESPERLAWLGPPRERAGAAAPGGTVARATNAVQRVVFQGALEQGYRGVTNLIAGFTEAIERLVFQAGVDRALGRTGAGAQRALLAFETRLGRPWVGAVVVGLVLLALVVGTR